MGPKQQSKQNSESSDLEEIRNLIEHKLSRLEARLVAVEHQLVSE